MFRCRICGSEIDEYQFRNFNQICSHCIRIQNEGNTSATYNINKELRIHTLEKRKSDLGGLMFLLFAVPSGILVGIFMGIQKGMFFLIPVLFFVIFVMIFLFYKVIKKFGSINKELKELEGHV